MVHLENKRENEAIGEEAPPIGLRDCVIGYFFLRDCVKPNFFLRECVKRDACVMRESPQLSA